MKYLIQPWAKHLLTAIIVIVILGFSHTNLFSQTHTFIITENYSASEFDGNMDQWDIISSQDQPVNPGDEILIYAGTGNHHAIEFKNIIGSASLPITIKNADITANGDTVITFLDNATELIKFTNCKYVNFEISPTLNGDYGLCLDGDLGTGRGITIDDKCTFLKIAGVYVKDTGSYGIRTSCNNPTSHYNSTVMGNDAMIEELVIDGCKFENTGNSSIYAGHSVFYGNIPNQPGTYYYNMKNMVVSDNIFLNLDGQKAIVTAGEIGTSEIYGNVLSSDMANINAEVGVMIWSGGSANIYNNQLYDISDYGIKDMGRHNTKIYNNVIEVADDLSTVNGNITIDNDVNAPTSFVKIYNNTIYGKDINGIYFNYNTSSLLNVHYNNAIITSETGIVNATTGSTLNESNNLVFTTPTEAGLHSNSSAINSFNITEESSTLIDAGKDLDGSATVNYVSLADDINSTARPQFCIHDVGAYEYTGSTTSQTLYLQDGWSFVSSYLEICEPDMPTVFSPVQSNLIKVMDEDGSYFYPSGTNGIGNMELGKAYKVNMDYDRYLTVTGRPRQPENVTISVTANQANYIGYLRTSAMAVGTAVAGLSYFETCSTDRIMDNQGNLYMPGYQMDQIGNMQPGQGYTLTCCTNDEFCYPANSTKSALATKTTSNPPNQHFANCPVAPNKMSVLFPSGSWDFTLNNGDEIAIVDSAYNVVGSGVYTGSHLAFPVWEEDQTINSDTGLLENEAFYVLYWDSQNNTTEQLSINWLTGSNLYVRDGISIAEAADQITKSELTNNGIISTSNIAPNPANDKVAINIMAENDCELEIDFINNLGNITKTLSKDIARGNNCVMVNIHDLEPGIYQVLVSNNSDRFVERLIKL